MDATAEFYDGLAGDYHLVYADWEASVRRQATALDRIIRQHAGESARRVLDCTCGIGTQAIGLAALGYTVTGTDLSPRSIARARAETEKRGLDARFEVADLRTLNVPGEPFDVVLSADNALPHLLSAADLTGGLRRMIAHLRPGGLLIASIRDYDAILEDPPAATSPVVTGESGRRRVTFQLWHWDPDGRTYDLELFVLREEPAGGWQADVHRARYRALRREELGERLRELGMIRVRWILPESSGFFQAVVLAVRPDGIGASGDESRRIGPNAR